MGTRKKAKIKNDKLVSPASLARKALVSNTWECHWQGQHTLYCPSLVILGKLMGNCLLHAACYFLSNLTMYSLASGFMTRHDERMVTFTIVHD